MNSRPPHRDDTVVAEKRGKGAAFGYYRGYRGYVNWLVFLKKRRKEGWVVSMASQGHMPPKHAEMLVNCLSMAIANARRMEKLEDMESEDDG